MFVGHFCPPGSGYGPRDPPLNPDQQIRIRINNNTGFFIVRCCWWSSPTWTTSFLPSWIQIRIKSGSESTTLVFFHCQVLLVIFSYLDNIIFALLDPNTDWIRIRIHNTGFFSLSGVAGDLLLPGRHLSVRGGERVRVLIMCTLLLRSQWSI